MQEGARYARQIQVKQFGIQGQKTLNGSRALIVGVGGLGCHVGLQLAGAGVGQITLIDHDTIDISNLHRQVLYRETDVGSSKVLIAQRELQSLNSQISISAMNERLMPSNVSDLVNRADTVSYTHLTLPTTPYV